MTDDIEQEQQEQQRQIDPEIEREALDMGWAPRERWRGKPEDFIDAPAFVERGRQVLPVVRAQLARERSERDRLAQELEATRNDFNRRLQAAEGMHRRTLEIQRAQIVEELEAQKRAAAANGDMEAYDRVRRREDDAYRRIAEEDKELQPKGTQETPPANQPPREVIEWAERNPWFTSDHGLSLEAQAIHMQLRQESPHMPLADNLAEVERQIKQRHPRKFGMREDGQRQAYQAVEGASSSRAAPARRAKGYAELPSEAKAAADRLIQMGMVKDKDTYAKAYWEEYGE